LAAYHAFVEHEQRQAAGQLDPPFPELDDVHEPEDFTPATIACIDRLLVQSGWDFKARPSHGRHR
jgi:hypothetical protein